MRVQLATAGVINNCSVSFSIAVKLRLFSLYFCTSDAARNVVKEARRG